MASRGINTKCNRCDWRGKSLFAHYYNSPECKPLPLPPPEPTPDMAYANALLSNTFREKMAQQILEMHSDNYMTNAMIEKAVSFMCKAVDTTLSEYETRLAAAAPTAVNVVAPVGKAVRLVTTGFLDASSTIEHAMRSAIGFVPPIEDPMGAGRNVKGEVARFYVRDIIKRILTLCPTARKLAYEASDEWKTGNLYQTKPERYVDITSGSRFRSRADILGKSTDPKELRIVLVGWEDDFTTTNPIGTKRGWHKYGAFLTGMLNLPKRMRFHTNYILLLALYQAKFAKENGGKLNILCGRDETDGTETTSHELCLADELESLRSGVEIMLPDDVGGEKPVLLRVFLLGVTADYLAAAALGPTPESTSGLRCCRDCLWLLRCPCAYVPADADARAQIEHDDLCQGCTPRTLEQLAIDVEQARSWSGSKTNLKKFMSRAGLGKLYCVTEFFPGVDTLDDLPIDIMHIFLCGLTRYELAWLLDVLIPAATTWAKVNERARLVRSSKGRKMPYVQRPKGDGARSSVSMSLTAVETMDFALASLEIIGPLLDDTWRESAAWKSWVAHVRLLTFCLQHEFEADDVERTDELVKQYLDLFAAVPQYAGFDKPKHHFLKHLSKYLARFGPFRTYWCMPWEAFLQILKRMFSMTNYKSAPTSVAKLWSLKSARALMAGPRIAWFEDVLIQTGPLVTDAHAPVWAESQLLRECLMTEVPTAMRMLRAVVRGPEEIALGGWVHVECDGVAIVGRVVEMAQLSFAMHNAVRIMCHECRVVGEGNVDDAGHLSVSTDGPCTEMVIRLEDCAVSVLHCSEVHEGYVLRPAL